MYFVVNTTASTVKGIALEYDRLNNMLHLYDDVGNYTPYGCIPGQNSTLHNSQGVLNCAQTSVPVPAPVQSWQDTTSAGLNTETCVEWLTRTGQAGTQRQTVDLHSGYVYTNTCTFISTNGSCQTALDTFGGPAAGNTWYPISSGNSGGINAKTQSFR